MLSALVLVGTFPEVFPQEFLPVVSQEECDSGSTMAERLTVGCMPEYIKDVGGSPW